MEARQLGGDYDTRPGARLPAQGKPGGPLLRGPPLNLKRCTKRPISGEEAWEAAQRRCRRFPVYGVGGCVHDGEFRPPPPDARLIASAARTTIISSTAGRRTAEHWAEWKPVPTGGQVFPDHVGSGHLDVARAVCSARFASASTATPTHRPRPVAPAALQQIVPTCSTISRSASLSDAAVADAANNSPTGSMQRRILLDLPRRPQPDPQR